MKAYFERQAEFCLATGFPPDVFDQLTSEQYEAFLKVHNKNNKK